jgi:hypothetical protein
MVHELGRHWGPGGKFAGTETVARSGVAASFAYGMFTVFEDHTLLQQVILPAAAYDALPRITPRYLVYAAGLGVVSGIVGLFAFVTLALGKAVGAKVSISARSAWGCHPMFWASSSRHASVA